MNGVFCLIDLSVLATTYFRPVGLSSALRRLTSLFGMGRGGSTASNHQNREIDTCLNLSKSWILEAIILIAFGRTNRIRTGIFRARLERSH